MFLLRFLVNTTEISLAIIQHNVLISSVLNYQLLHGFDRASFGATPASFVSFAMTTSVQ